MDQRSAFAKAVESVLRETKPGDILTYGEVAAEAGYPGAARAVGNFLRSASSIPWWRVVAANGRLHKHGAAEQAVRLREEDVSVENGSVVRIRR